MQSGRVPDFFRYWIRLVAKPRDCFRKCQRRAFGFGTVRRFTPGRYREQTLVCLPRLLKLSTTHVDADTTAIDLAGAKVDEIKRALGHTAFPNGSHKSHQWLHRVRNQHRGIFHSWLYGFHFFLSFIWFLCDIAPENFATS